MKFARFSLRLFAASFGLVSAPALATDSDVCVEAHFSAQVARAHGELLRAEELLSTCGDAVCAGVLREECGTWLAEVASEIPSLVVAVTNPTGQDILAYELLLDGRPARPNGLGIVRLDPGDHELAVSASGYETKKVHLAVRVRERHRRVEIVLVPLREPARSFLSAPLLVGGGLALAGGVTFALLGLDARASEEHLEDCSPRCSDARIGDVEAKYVAANVALGIGIAALAGGVLVWALTPNEPNEGAAVSLDFRHGAPTLGFRGRF